MFLGTYVLGGVYMISTHIDRNTIAMITGKLLGDGSITVHKGRWPRFQYSHRCEDKEWVFHCYNSLNKYFPLSPPAYKKVIDPRLIKGYSACYYVQSKKHPLTKELESIWYQTRVKHIPYDFISYFFNDISLAWWYQDDGCLLKEKNKVKKVILSVESFSKDDILWMKTFLKTRYQLDFKTDGQNRLILYNQFDILYFLHLVGQYIHTSMWRKNIGYSSIDFRIPSKRTTLYLPSNFSFRKPTAEINAAIEEIYKLIKIIKEDRFYLEWFNTFEPFINPVNDRTSYQINIEALNYRKLELVKSWTGLTYSDITSICLLLQSK